MTYPSTVTYYPVSVEVIIPEPHVVAYLANANGEPITKPAGHAGPHAMASAVYIRTEVFDDDDAAWSRYDELVSASEPPLFLSCQDSRGESIV